MAAPTYKWEFNSDLFGDRVPKIATFELTASAYCKVGTLMSLVSGQALPTTDGTGQYIIGIAAEDIDVAASGGDPVKIAVLAPGMVIKGTSTATAAAYSGATAKTFDLNSDGRLDQTDTTGGGLAVIRTENSGLTVYCVVCVGAIIG
jgi:hypothetical protein